MARLLKTDGTEERVVPAKGNKFTLEELQGYVGGYIERMPMQGLRMYVNEEGLLKELPPNTLATQLVSAILLQQGRPLRYVPYIVGPAIVLEEGESE